MERVRIETGHGAYDLAVGRGLLLQAATLCPLKTGSRVLIVSDEAVAPLYAERLAAALPEQRVALCVVPSGEGSKSHAQLFRIYDAMLAHGMMRSDTLIALGGGVVGDLAGYAAATFMRGTPFVQVPTTLLAMVDSSVGGKVAVNLPQGKNLIGAFHQPAFVLADLDTLSTLDGRQLRSGMAEVVKHGLIADADFFAEIERAGRLERALNEQAIAHNCRIKASYVARDELDTGVRMELNFGHTLGHAIEAVAGYGAVLHGEGVSIGMLFAARLGERLGVTPPGTAARIRVAMEALGMAVRMPALDRRALLDAMAHDKKSFDGALRFVLLEHIGRARVQAVSMADIEKQLGEDTP